MNARPMLHSLSRPRAVLGLKLGLSVGMGLALAAAVAGHAVAGGHAAAGPAPGSNGSIVITDHELNPALSSFQKNLKTEARSALSRNPETENWRLHFIAYLNRAPGTEDVNLVFYDPQPPKAGQPREPVQAFPIHTKATAKILMSQIDLRPEDGFKAGNKYQVLVTRLINGKEDVYARGTIELTDKAPAKADDKAAKNPDDKSDKKPADKN